MRSTSEYNQGMPCYSPRAGTSSTALPAFIRMFSQEGFAEGISCTEVTRGRKGCLFLHPFRNDMQLICTHLLLKCNMRNAALILLKSLQLLALLLSSCLNCAGFHHQLRMMPLAFKTSPGWDAQLSSAGHSPCCMMRASSFHRGTLEALILCLRAGVIGQAGLRCLQMSGKFSVIHIYNIFDP